MTSKEIVKLLSEYPWVNFSTNTYYYQFGEIIFDSKSSHPRASVYHTGRMSISYTDKERIHFDDVEKFRRAILKEKNLLNFK